MVAVYFPLLPLTLSHLLHLILPLPTSLIPPIPFRVLVLVIMLLVHPPMLPFPVVLGSVIPSTLLMTV